MNIKNNKIIKNIFIGYKKKPSQLMLVVMLLTLSIGSFFVVNNSTSKVQSNFEQFAYDSNMLHGTIEFFPYIGAFSQEEQNIAIERAQELIDPSLDSLSAINAAFNDVTTRIQLELIYNEYVFPFRIQNMMNDNDVIIEIEKSLTYYQDKYIFEIISYDYSNTINLPMLIEGHLPNVEGEIALYPEFLEENGLKVGDFITIDNTEFLIVGSMYAAHYSYPVLSGVPNSNSKYETIAYVVESDLYANSSLLNLSYSYYVTFENYTIYDLEDINSLCTSLTSKYDTDEYHYMRRIRPYSQRAQVVYLYNDIELITIVGSGISSLMLIVTVLLIGFLIRRKILFDSKYIGLFKASGYTNNEITRSYMILPTLISGISIILSLIICFTGTEIFYSYLSNSYAMPNTTPFYLSFSVLLEGAIIPLLFILVVSYIIIYVLLNKSTVDLLVPDNKVDVIRTKPEINHNNNISKILSTFKYIPKRIIYIISILYSKFKLFILFMFRKRSFPTRFKYNLVLRSPYKLLSVIFTVFVSCVLLSLTLMSSTVATNLLTQYDNTFNYDYMFKYEGMYSAMYEEGCNEVSSECIYTNDDSIALSVIPFITAINGKESSKEETVELWGVRSLDNDMLNIVDIEGNDISHLLTKGFVATSNYARFNNISIGDTISLHLSILQIDEYGNSYVKTTEFTETVVGITDNFYYSRLYYGFEQTNQVFLDRTEYTDDSILGYHFNHKFTNSTDNLMEELPYIMSVYDMDLLRESLVTIADLFDYIFIFISIICLVLSLSSLIILTIFTIEDNLSNIVVLKILGYTDKEISQMVLNLYTPIIICTFFVAVFITSLLFGNLIHTMEDFLGFVLPNDINALQLLVGLAFVLIVYKTSLFITKRSITNVSLQELSKDM